MVRVFIVMVLGAVLFFVGAWNLGLFEKGTAPVFKGSNSKQDAVAREALGNDLYSAVEFPGYTIRKRQAADPIVLYGVMNPRDEEEVPSQVNGRVLFIGEELDQDVAPLAGSAALLTEPYYFATVEAGRQTFVKFYRRLYEGQTIVQNQMLAMIEPAKALGVVLEKLAKIDAAHADQKAADASEKEGKTRLDVAAGLFARKAIAFEEYRSAELTYIKMMYERVQKDQAVKLAYIEKDQADIELRQHEIRPLMPYKNSLIKTILKQQGYAVKQGDPILVVQNLERLQAEAQIEEPYFERLKDQKKFTATIEPTLQVAPLHELSGHTRDVTSLAVARDMKIVSGSEDRTVCIWSPDTTAPLRKLEHDDAVLVVACTPVSADHNWFLAGCQDGSIHLWSLDGKEIERLQKLDQAHGKDTSITSLAFSPDGKWFASGASDGSIKLWSASEGKLQYSFDPEHGVAQCHEDAVTALHFTPQGRLVSAGRDKTLRVWFLKEKGAYEDGKANHDRSGNVASLGVSPDGKWMLFDLGRTLQLQSVQTRQMVHTISTPTNSTPFDTLAIFSPDGSLILTAGAPEGRLQLWRTPDESTNGFEVRQYATKARNPVNCAAFSPAAGKGGANSFAVSGSGMNLYLWSIPTQREVNDQRIENVPLTLKNHNINTATHQIRIGFEVLNPVNERYPSGRFEAGRPVTIVID